jgi:CBS domain-containing protein
MPDPTPRDPQTDANRRQRSRRLELLVRDRWLDRGGMSSLAKTIGVSRATLYSWLRGDTVPDLDAMSRLADALGLMPSELLALVGDDELPGARSLEVRSMLAAPEAPQARDAWDPDWMPPSRAQLRMESPSYGVRRISPPRRDVRLLDVLVGSQVMTAHADEPLGPVLERMYNRAYSQVPVYRGKNLIGLLTGETVARWYAANMSARPFGHPTSVSSALEFAEEGPRYGLVGPDATPADAVTLFDQAMRSGAPIAALLITSDATAGGKALGIVTTADLPVLHRFQAR